MSTALTQSIADFQGDHLSAKIFLAAGDGSTDDGAQFANAFTALTALGGGDLLVPKSRSYYKITSPLTVPSNVRLMLQHKAEIRNTTAHGGVLVFNGASNAGVTGGILTASNNAPVQATGSSDGIAIKVIGGSDEISIEKCLIQGHEFAGVYIDTATNVKIQHNYFTGAVDTRTFTNTPTGGDVLSYGSSSDVDISYNRSDSYNDYFCELSPNTTATSSCARVDIHHNTVSNKQQDSIILYGNAGTNTQAVSFCNVYSNKIKDNHSRLFNSLAGSVTNGGMGIYLANADDCSVHNNTLDNCLIGRSGTTLPEGAISLNACYRPQIANNTVRQNWPLWSSSAAYSVNDMVNYQGTIYCAILAGTNHTPSSSPTYWAGVGLCGIHVASLNLRVFAWDATTAYVVGNTATYNQQLWTSILNGTNQQPDTSPTYWTATEIYTIGGSVEANDLTGCGITVSGSDYTSISGGKIQPGALITGIQITGSVHVTVQAGVHVVGGGNAITVDDASSYVTIAYNTWERGHGAIVGCDYPTIVGNKGKNSASGTAGLALSSGATRSGGLIAHNQLFDDQTTPTQSYGIIENGTYPNAIFIGNSCRANGQNWALTSTSYQAWLNTNLANATGLAAAPFEIAGPQQATSALVDGGLPSLYLANDTNATTDSGGAYSFSAQNLLFAAIKSCLQNGSGAGTGDLAFSLRSITSDTHLTEKMRLLVRGALLLGYSVAASDTYAALQVNGAIRMNGPSFASLAPATNAGTILYCPDAKNVLDGVAAGSVAVGGGTGAMLGYTNSQWRVMC